MKIGYFTQNCKKGGLDTFVIELLSHWPEGDELVLFCNNSHPGLDNLRQKLSLFVKIVPYKFMILPDFKIRFNSWPNLVGLLAKVFFWFFGFSYQVSILHRILKDQELDSLMVINGGYPGGEACLASIIAWEKINPERKAWHNLHNFVTPLPTNRLRKFKNNWIDSKIARSTHGFVSVSKACRDSIENRPVFKKVNNVYIYNGISPLKPRKKTNLKKELELPADVFILLMLGVYEPRKGHHFMIKVMEQVIQKVPQAHLLVCGDGSEEEFQVVENLRQKSPAKSKIHLQYHRPDIENLLSQTDIQVVPSQSYESFGYTALEAMACGVPVMATSVGGLKEVVLDGDCGFVEDCQNVDGFAQKIVELLLDEDLRKKMGLKGLKRFEQHFTADRMSRQYADIVYS